MKKNIITRLLGIFIFVLYFGNHINKAEAAEVDDINILIETDTSTVIDMGRFPSAQISSENLSYNNPYNSYDSLKVPAQITRQGNYYFIVDCYHDQILYSDSIEKPIRGWRVMTNKVNQPHAIASDGQVYLVADTENNRVLIFEQKNGRFRNTQKLDNIGIRPHYITYDASTDTFFVWSSMTGDMYILKKEPVTGIVCIQEIRHINELENFYVRSFTISGDIIIFPSGTNGYMIIADKDTMEVYYRYPVSLDISGMAYVMPIGEYFYMTVSTDFFGNQNIATIIRTKDLSTLANGEYEDMYDMIPTKGVPYYIDMINGMYYMTNHGSAKTVWRFSVEDDLIKNVSAVY